MTASSSLEETSDVQNAAAVSPPRSSSTISAVAASGDWNTRTQPENSVILTEKRVVSEENLAGEYDFEIPKCRIPPAEKLDPVLSYVATAVTEQHAKKDDTLPIPTYKGILDALRVKRDLEMIHMVFLALRTSGTTLSLLTKTTNKHSRLLHSIFKFDPFDVGHNHENSLDLVDAYLYLLIALVSANNVFLVNTITSLWKILTQSSETDPQRLTQRAQRVHACFRVLVKLCPKSKNELFTAISTYAPFRLKPQSELDWYYQQCLRVVQYNPSIRAKVLDLMVDKCLEMDVEIRIDDGGVVVIESDEDGDSAGIFELDMDDKPKREEVSNSNRTVDEMADKLDSLMNLLFTFIQSTSQWTELREIYEIFAHSFESSILSTHKSKFVQFLLLYICGKEHSSCQVDPSLETLDRVFASQLVRVVVNPLQAASLRQTGACYLASFVSRAHFVTPETVCEAVNALLSLAEAYVKALGEHSIHAPDSREQCNLHSLFYTVCQSAFYIMCFRGSEAVAFYESKVENDPTDETIQHINIGASRWNHICSHPLQPLRYCLESVRSEFLHLSQMYSLMDVTLLQSLMIDDGEGTNRKRTRIAQKIKSAVTLKAERRTGGVGGLGAGKNPLDSFFPFDPYLLRHSHHFIEPYYRHWSDLVDEVTMDQDDGDSSVGDESLSSAQTEADSSDDEDDDTNNEHMVNPGSLLSRGTVSSRSQSMIVGTVNSEVSTQDGWERILTRARAQSIENGSW